MRHFLKEAAFTLPDGEALTIRELSAGGRRALIEETKSYKGDVFRMAAVTVRYGCPEFADETVDAVLDAMPSELLNDLSTAILKLSGISVDSEAQAEKN